MRKGEDAGYPFPTMFLRAFLLRVILTHSHTMTPFDAPGKQAF